MTDYAADARDALEHSDDPSVVAAAALQLRDLSGLPRMGGGFAILGRARPYAVDVVLALSLRGFLNPPRPRRPQNVHPSLFEAGGDT